MRTGEGKRGREAGMPFAFVAYTAAGLLEGSVAGDGRLGDRLEAGDSIRLAGAVLQALDGSPPEAADAVEIPTDDLLLVVAPDDSLPPAHAAWHTVELVLGPYAVVGELPTLPGFDPARALARPGGQFVLLARTHVQLAAATGGGGVEHPLCWVNRYAVDEVRADLDLMLYFPGARTGAVATGRPPG